MDSFKSRLKQIIDENDLSKAEIARRIGASRSALNGWLNGEYEANSENIYKLARLFDVTEAWLLGFVDERQEVEIKESKKDSFLLPLLNVSAGKEEDDQSQIHEMVECPSHLSYLKDNLFAIRVIGESMNKIIPNGSTIICARVDEKPKSGQIVVYRNGSDYNLKRFTETENLILFEPVSFDGSFETIIYKKTDDIEIEILGVVKHSCMSFE